MRSAIWRLGLTFLLITPGCNRTPPTDGSWGWVDVVVRGSGDGDGQVRSDEVDITCSLRGVDSCEFSFGYVLGDFSLHAYADPGHLFAGWGPGGVCSGQANCNLHNASAPATLTAYATFLRIPTEIRVEVADQTLELGQETFATATADPPLPDSARITWTSADPSVIRVTPGSPLSTATLTAVGPGSATLIAEARNRFSGPVTVTVTDPASRPTYSAERFVQVPDPVEIDIDAQGNLYVANSNATAGDYGAAVPVRKVSPEGGVTVFGDHISDPDALIVDRQGSIGTLGAGSVLVGGGVAGTNLHRITEISSDGTTTRVLIESTPPDLMNPTSFAVLSNGDMIVANWSNNTATRLRRDAQGSLHLEPLFAETDAPNGLRSVVVLNRVVYMVTGFPRLVALNENGEPLSANLWPSDEEVNPGPLAADVVGSFENDLLAAALDGRILRMDTESGAWSRVGDFTFSQGVCGMVVSPLDGTLYVAECDGQIWKVTRD